jgi:hypothetical protein
VSLSGKLANKGRNICVQVLLLETDTVGLTDIPEGLPNIFQCDSGGSSSAAALGTHATTAVVYHTRSPIFMDEFKIQLPMVLTERHHLFFTIYHVSVESSKCEKRARRLDSAVGFAFLPLVDQQTGRRITGELQIPIVAAGVHYDGFILPVNYLAHANPDKSNNPIKWVDHGRHIFKLRAEQASSIYSPDDQLRNFFAQCESEGTDTRSSDMVRALRSLQLLSTDALFAF